jgi:hypothetical protein
MLRERCSRALAVAGVLRDWSPTLMAWKDPSPLAENARQIPGQGASGSGLPRTPPTLARFELLICDPPPDVPALAQGIAVCRVACRMGSSISFHQSPPSLRMRVMG